MWEVNSCSLNNILKWKASHRESMMTRYSIQNVLSTSIPQLIHPLHPYRQGFSFVFFCVPRIKFIFFHKEKSLGILYNENCKYYKLFESPTCVYKAVCIKVDFPGLLWKSTKTVMLVVAWDDASWVGFSPVEN